MSTAKMDAKKRIVLPSGTPGDIFDIQQQADGRYVLVRLEKPKRADRFSKTASLKAMRARPLRSTMTWEQLRELTREP